MLGDLGKLFVAKGFKKLPKIQKIARSGHTGRSSNMFLSKKPTLGIFFIKNGYIWGKGLELSGFDCVCHHAACEQHFKTF